MTRRGFIGVALIGGLAALLGGLAAIRPPASPGVRDGVRARFWRRGR